MKTLVTGGAGFIGSHLCERLLKRGDTVFCLDNLSTGLLDNVDGLREIYKSQFEIIIESAQNLPSLYVDRIYHLASPASPVFYGNFPIETLEANVVGTKKVLDLALKTKARVVFTSTSEIYGDPEIHPQVETYNGNVDPNGPRACYDESKRCGETLCSVYHNSFGVDARIVRIFNSLTGDQQVVYYKDGLLYRESFEECYERIEGEIEDVQVPCFNHSGEMVLSPISSIEKHFVSKKGYEVKTSWGKTVTVTQDHGLFRRNSFGEPEDVFCSELEQGDWIAAPSYMPCIERPFQTVVLSNLFCEENLSFLSPKVPELVEKYEERLNKSLKQEGVSNQAVWGYRNRYIQSCKIPKRFAEVLSLETLECRVGPTSGKGFLYNQIEYSDELLWILGFYLAEGCVVCSEKDWVLLFTSNEKYLEKLLVYSEKVFGLSSKIHWSNGVPNVALRSKLLVKLFCEVWGFGFSLASKKSIPQWILQLPCEQLRMFLYGFWQGDGNHDAKTTREKIIFNTSSEELLEALNFAMLRFGLTGSRSEFQTRVRKEDEKTYTAYRLTIQGSPNNDLFSFEQMRGKQKRSRTMLPDTKDLAWAKILSIKEIEIEEEVYDFSVPCCENFVGGEGLLCCHNTYGPRMREDDGRVVSNFITQALLEQNITLYGDGTQTRSFQYIDDLVEGLVRVMSLDKNYGPINLGRPEEVTVRELATRIIELTGSNSELVCKPLPKGDPCKRKPNIDKAKELLRWQPQISLESGLVKTIDHFQRRKRR